MIASNVPFGLGEPVFDRLDADIAKALMSINAVKGVEIGAGFDSVVQKGSEHRDEITADGFLSNHAGGCLVAFHQARTLLQILLSSRHPAFVYREGLSRPVARNRGGHDWASRPLRWYQGDPHRRGDAGVDANGPLSA